MPFCGAAERAALKLHRSPEGGLGYDAQARTGGWTDNATGCLKAVLQRLEVALPAFPRPLQGSLNSPKIKEILSHRDRSTTMIYTHILNRGSLGISSPVEIV